MVTMFFKCPFCSCLFCSQADLDLHLKAFGANPHIRALRCVHVLSTDDDSVLLVDEHDDWNWSRRDFIHSNTIRACRDFLCIR